MDKNSFFSASELSTDREKANKLSVYTFKVLFRIFTVASLIMWGAAPVIRHFDQIADAMRSVFCFLSFISFLMLLVGYRNVRRWYFPLRIFFVFTFGSFIYLMLSTTALYFTIPSAVVCGLVLLLSRQCRRMPSIISLCGIVILTAAAIIPIGICLSKKMLGFSASIHLLIFMGLVMIVLKGSSYGRHPYERLAKENVFFLIISHITLASFILISALVIML